MAFRAKKSRQLPSGRYRSRIVKVTYVLRTLTVWFQITTGTKQGGTFCHDFEILEDEFSEKGVRAKGGLLKSSLEKLVNACGLTLEWIMPSDLYKRLVDVVVDKGLVTFEAISTHL